MKAHEYRCDFRETIMERLNPKDPLVLLSETIPWDSLCSRYVSRYPELGRPAEDVRLMIGLLILQRIEHLNDDQLVVEWTRNPYYQAFCGESHFHWEFPCDVSDIERFRRRIGDKGYEAICRASVQKVLDDIAKSDGKEGETAPFAVEYLHSLLTGVAKED